ncbi:apolipoprotein N-acyltransferase [Methylomonas sp. EbA]|uniref:Apolipoprotein N-acyltransferase n=2 Tax=Methylomonas albis TaxID=1854563 RepID=A0ABR9CWT0_9GAMM|nr:apolipoprotein N-acyltransferase [Methylomonas albis]
MAFAPYDYAYAAVAALMFMYWVWQQQAPNRAALSGYLFGLGLFSTGIWWTYISIHDFGGGDPYSAIALTALLVAVWALFPALTGWMIAKTLLWSGPWLRIIAAAIVWVTVEYFRGYWLLNGFPWLQIAYSQLSTPLAGFAPLVGVYGVGFLLALSAFAAVEMFRGKLTVLRCLPVLVSIWVGGWYLQSVAWTQAAGAPIKVTLVQGNIGQDQKWQKNQKLNTLRLYQELTEQHWDSDVIIWPETSIPAFLSQVKEFYIDPLQTAAQAHGVDLVVGLPSSGQGKDYYNSVMTLGEKQALYHKNHLLPFGEYLPLQPLSGWVLDKLQIPLGDFAAGGDQQTLLTAGGHAFVTTICYEDAFGELVARQVADAGYIVNMTNDAWFGDSSQPHQHMQMARMRALETGRYLVRVTNTGVTGFVGPDGALRSQAPLFNTTTLTDYIVPMSGLTPYVMLGDKGLFGLLAVLLLLVYAWSRWCSAVTFKRHAKAA